MAKKYSEVAVEVTPVRKDGKMTYMVVATGLTYPQVKELHVVFEPRSRRWRGQYQELAKAIVAGLRGLLKTGAFDTIPPTS